MPSEINQAPLQGHPGRRVSNPKKAGHSRDPSNLEGPRRNESGRCILGEKTRGPEADGNLPEAIEHVAGSQRRGGSGGGLPPSPRADAGQHPESE